MHRFRTRTGRRVLLLAAGCAALTLLVVWIAQRADDDKQPPQDITTAPPVSTKAEPAPAESESVSKTDGEAEKASPPPLPYGDRLVPEGYEWGDPHPWLVKVRGEFHRRYIGPQTAEAIFAVMDSGHPRYQQNKADAAKLLEHYRYILSRGAVIRDKWDAGRLGQQQLNKFNHFRNDPDTAAYYRKALGLAADATLQGLMDAEIDDWIKIWPSMKGQLNYADKTGESTLNVTLTPDGLGNGFIGIYTVGRVDRRELTPVEEYNIARHGIAPKGFRLRFVDEDDNALPFDQVPFFSERDVVKHWSDAELEEQLIALPAYMNQPEALEQPNVVWMSMVDRYDAALAELEARRQSVPPLPAAPAADGAPAQLRPSPGLRESGSEPPPVLQRETEQTEARAKREAALAAVKAEGVQRVAEAYVEALKELEKRKNISSEAREKLARRILELRALSKAPTAPPVSPPDSQGSSSSEEEEED